MEKFIESLQEAGKKLALVEHLLQVTYPMAKEKNILLKSLGELKKATVSTINSALQFDYYIKEINLSRNPGTNYKTFKSKSAEKYSLTKEEINAIEEIFELEKQHQESPMEFKRKEKVVIFSGSSNPEEISTISVDKIKDLEKKVKSVLKKIQKNIQKQYWRKI